MVFISAKSGHNVPPQLLMGIDSPQCTERCHRRGKPQPPLRMHWGSAVLWGLLLVLLATTPTATARTCREAALCCNGRDSSCVVQKAPINSIIEDPVNDKPCYCDHACLKLGDCCDDFKQFCGVLDCQVSEWEPWSECDATCGTGIMTRNLRVLRIEAD